MQKMEKPVVCFCLFLLGIAVVTLSNPATAQMTFHIQPFPCRVLDTRGGALGVTPIPAGSVINVTVRGTNAWISQGGQTGCGTAATAKAVSATLTAVHPDRAGHVLAWAYGTPANQVPGQTATMVLNSGLSDASTVVLPLCTLALCTYDVSIFAVPAVDYTLDLIGWFE